MSLWVRIQDGKVAERFTPPEGQTPADCFAPGLTWDDVTAVSPQPDQGWGATLLNGVWSYSPPPPLSLQDQANLALSAHIAQGVVITSTGTPGFHPTMALDQDTIAAIQPVAQDAASGLGLPDDAETVSFADLSGAPHDFTAPQIIAVYKVQRNLVTKLNAAAGVMAKGGTPTWPAQTGTMP